ncbi:hypothetical protein E4U54_006760 [Claviceps lovelessii]|nr:hypothetical protein E4U54_006760 [Claviceps lovelessii]
MAKRWSLRACAAALGSHTEDIILDHRLVEPLGGIAPGGMWQVCSAPDCTGLHRTALDGTRLHQGTCSRSQSVTERPGWSGLSGLVRSRLVSSGLRLLRITDRHDMERPELELALALALPPTLQPGTARPARR